MEETSVKARVTRKAKTDKKPVAEKKPVKTSSVKKTGNKKTAKKAAVKAAPRTRTRKTTASKSGKAKKVSPQERYRMIAEAAYLKAEKRSFMPGSEYDDWIEAEREVDAILNRIKLTGT